MVGPGADVEAMRGEPVSAAVRAVLVPVTFPGLAFGGAEQVGADEWGVLAAKNARLWRPGPYAGASFRAHRRAERLERPLRRAWTSSVPTARWQQHSQQQCAEEGDTVRHVYLLSPRWAVPPDRRHAVAGVCCVAARPALGARTDLIGSAATTSILTEFL